MVDSRSVSCVGTASPPGRWLRAPALDLVLAQDDSPSVGRADGFGPDAIRVEAARLAIALMEGRARVAFTAFGAPDRARRLPLRSVDCEESRRDLVAEIEAATGEKGSADYPDALRSVMDALTEGDPVYGRWPYRSEGRSVGVLFLSDGAVPDRRQLVELGARGGLYEWLRQRRWPVFTIGIGGGVRHPWSGTVLRDLADATGGRSLPGGAPHRLLCSCADAVAQLTGRRWTPATTPAPVPAVRHLDLEANLEEATFVALRAGGDVGMRVVDPGGTVVRDLERRTSRWFETATVVRPRPGRWTVALDGTGLAGAGLLTSGPAGCGGPEREGSR